MLIVFSGLPGSGKSTLARALATCLRANYLRLDTIEAALLNVGLPSVGVEGYAVAYALAADALSLGQTVVADGVNPLTVTRKAWQAVARNTSSRILDVEVICSDVQEHRRRRVEARRDDPAHQTGRWIPPTWDRVERHEYAPWTSERTVVDTAQGTTEDQVARLLALTAPPSGSSPAALVV